MRKAEAINRDILAIKSRLEKAWSQVEKKDDGFDFSNVTVYGDIDTKSKIAAFIDDQKRADQLMAEKAEAEAIEKAGAFAESPAENPATVRHAVARETLAQKIAKSPAIAEWKNRPGISSVVSVDPLEFKATFSLSSYVPETVRSGRVELTATRPIRVLDLPSVVRASTNAYKFMRESTFTNAAAEIAEAAVYPEAALAYSEVSVPIQKIAVTIPVTDEQLEDNAGVQDLIENRLTEMVRLRLDSQLLNGNGTAPNITGYLNTSGINAHSKGADSVLDALYKGKEKVRTIGRAEPDAIVIHPDDWSTIRLAKTTDGVYIMGAPTDAGPATLWGVRVVVTDAISAGTVLAGSFATHSALVMRSDLEVATGYINDQFTRGMQSIRLDMRCALAVYRPAAFTAITLA